jgi:hypothetical protein
MVFSYRNRGMRQKQSSRFSLSDAEFLSFATGRVTTLAQLSGRAAYGFSVSPDGRWLLYSQYEQKGADLMLVENFR